MSTRIRTDGRRYNPETDLEVRPFHKPEPSAEPPTWKCAICGEPWLEVRDSWTGGEGSYRRHYPGTFWARD